MKDGDRVTKRSQTVRNAQRMAYPGVYKRPDVIAAEAASRVAPEDPMLKRLFGGLLYLTGFIIMAYNLGKTVAGKKGVKDLK